MNVSSTQKLIKALNHAAQELGAETSLRQLQSFLLVALTGTDGIDASTVEKKTGASQAATSRVLKMLGPELGLAEFFLDQNDGRRRLSRLTSKGNKVVNKMLNELDLT